VSTCAIYKPVAPASTKQTQPLTEKSPTISESVSLTISKASEHNAQIREQLLKSQVQSSPSSAILSSVSEKSLSELANIMSAEGIDK
jgi:predicted MarR family transcription regulator